MGKSKVRHFRRGKSAQKGEENTIFANKLEDTDSSSDSEVDDDLEKLVSHVFDGMKASFQGKSPTAGPGSPRPRRSRRVSLSVSQKNTVPHSLSQKPVPEITDSQHKACSFVIDKKPDTAAVLGLDRNASKMVGSNRNVNKPVKNVQSETESESDSETEANAASTLTADKARVRAGDKKRVSKSDEGSLDKLTFNDPVSNRRIKETSLHLASRLDSGVDLSDLLYVSAATLPGNMASAHSAARKAKLVDRLLHTSKGDMMKKSVITPDYEKKDQIPPYEESRNQKKKQSRLERGKTKGKNWFDMAAPELTEDQRNSLTVLQMRRSLDPKRFYKAPDSRGLPKYFQMGKVVDNPVDFYHSRIPKKQRKANLVDELLDDAQFRKYNKRKYAEVVEMKQKKRGAYKHMQNFKKRKSTLQQH